MARHSHYAMGLVINEIDKAATPLIVEGDEIVAIIISKEFAEELKVLCDGIVPSGFVTHHFPGIPVRVSTQKENFVFELAHPNPKLPDPKEWHKGEHGQ